MNRGTKERTWWLRYLESSAAKKALGSRHRGIIEVWLTDFLGEPININQLHASCEGVSASRADKKMITTDIQSMIQKGLILRSGDTLALPSQLVGNILLTPGRRSGVRWATDTRPSGDAFKGLNYSELNEFGEEVDTGEDSERDSKGRPDPIKNKERGSEKILAEADPVSPFFSDAGSQAGFRGTSSEALVVLVQESDRLRAIRYPSSESDPTSGYPKILKELGSLVDRFGYEAVLGKIRTAYSEGMFVERRGENITLAAIVNGFEYIQEKPKMGGKLVLNAEMFESDEPSVAESMMRGFSFGEDVAAAGDGQERQNGG